MAINSSVHQLFLAGEENDFGFELFPVEPEDLALSQWELVHPSDAGSDLSEEPYADRGSDCIIDEAIPALSPPAVPWMAAGDDMDEGLDRSGNPGPSDGQFMLALVEYFEQFRDQGFIDDTDSRDDYEEDDDDGLDDELVPRHLAGKLGRQRMRKLGKRACSKMNSSKRSPHLYMKPGCLYGKHGLGLKHCL